jgi:ubiquinone/menaquinone biosynthesis C-methylase UbiE
MSLSGAVLEHSQVYRLWQAPFAEQKFSPVRAHNDLSSTQRVLDVACGPGTNTHHFAHSDYIGIDFNERYIRDARERHRREFVVADVRNYTAAPEDRFDFVLVNSFLHHLDTKDVSSILSHLGSLLTENGHVHILELVMPEDPSVSRLLARWDRGKFARPLEEWRTIFHQLFEPVVFEPYRVIGAGVALWNMVYFKGRSKA